VSERIVYQDMLVWKLEVVVLCVFVWVDVNVCTATVIELIVLYNYFMVSVFGWPDPNTRECCEKARNRVEGEWRAEEDEPKASDFARFS
jgi:ABC-type transport system involved in Fe-S cluster assembly fused permease/ATPase subunit